MDAALAADWDRRLANIKGGVRATARGPRGQLADWTFFAIVLAILTAAAPLSGWLEL